MVLSNIKDKIKGNVKFIFQPAEEGAPQDEEGGAALMIKEGVLDDPAVGAIFGLHVWPENVGQVYFSTGDIMAGSDLFEITIKGKSAHGARPQEGIDAIVLAAEIITTLQSVISRSVDPGDPAVLTIGKIEGGTRSNIIAEKVTLEGTVRALSETNRKKIPQIMESVVKGISQAFGATSTFDYRQTLPSVYNHPEFGQTMLPTLIGVLGKNNVLPLQPQMVAEDFSFYGQRIPGFFFFLGVKSPSQATTAALHSPNFNPDERSIPLGIKLMCHLLLDSLDKQNPLESPPSIL
jgi:amidohydrolase